MEPKIILISFSFLNRRAKREDVQTFAAIMQYCAAVILCKSRKSNVMDIVMCISPQMINPSSFCLLYFYHRNCQNQQISIYLLGLGTNNYTVKKQC